eukprot:6181805-Pleurochrysis_carterae.AAC.2
MRSTQSAAPAHVALARVSLALEELGPAKPTQNGRGRRTLVGRGRPLPSKAGQSASARALTTWHESYGQDGSADGSAGAHAGIDVDHSDTRDGARRGDHYMTPGSGNGSRSKPRPKYELPKDPALRAMVVEWRRREEAQWRSALAQREAEVRRRQNAFGPSLACR